MTIGISAIPGLPSYLQALIDQVNAEQIDYSGRDSDAEQLKGYLAKGDNSLAKYIAEQMIKRQQQYRHALAHGLPQQLQALIDQVNAEQIDYSGRDSDAEQLKGYLAKGDNSLAKYIAEQMIKRQQQYRHALAHGLPQQLQALIDQVNAEQIDYSGRDSDAEQLKGYLAKGDNSLAKYIAEQMIERQQQYRHALAHGLPQHLQALIDQVNAEQIDYSGRDSDAEQLEGYLAKGDNSLAKYIAEQMIERQQQYRHALAHGLPQHLQALIDQVNAEQIDYSGRDSDAEQLEGYLAKGDNSLAKYIAEQMIERQRNLHARNIEAASPD